jgi:hypothetical protein
MPARCAKALCQKLEESYAEGIEDVRQVAVKCESGGSDHATHDVHRSPRSPDQHRFARDAQARRRTSGAHHDGFCGQEAAQRAIEQAEVVRLSLADQACFAQALLSPAQPVPALARAFARRRKLLRAE